MASTYTFYTSSILNVSIPEDEFEEPTPLKSGMTLRIPSERKVYQIDVKDPSFQERELDIARKRIAERNSAFQRRIQYETAMIRRAIRTHEASRVLTIKS